MNLSEAMYLGGILKDHLKEIDGIVVNNTDIIIHMTNDDIESVSTLVEKESTRQRFYCYTDPELGVAVIDAGKQVPV